MQPFVADFYLNDPQEKNNSWVSIKTYPIKMHFKMTLIHSFECCFSQSWAICLCSRFRHFSSFLFTGKSCQTSLRSSHIITGSIPNLHNKFLQSPVSTIGMTVLKLCMALDDTHDSILLLPPKSSDKEENRVFYWCHL